MNHLEPKPPPTLAAALWRQHYEALRQLAVSENPPVQVDSMGGLLLLRQGVAGWMRHWFRLVAPASATPPLAPPPPVVSTPQWQQQLTQLLAQMSLVHLSK